MTYRPWIVGHNPAEPIGSSIGDGITGRVTDPTTGAGLFNPDLDPAVVGVDALTGSDAPVGTDMSFGAAIRRQMQTNVINGDFSVLPPLGASTNVDSDPASAGYNPLPGWTWTPAADGGQVAQIVADSSMASGYKLLVEGLSSGTRSILWQMIAVPMSQGQQYRVLLSLYAIIEPGVHLRYQFYRADAVTAIGSQVTSPSFGASAELKVDAGLVPPTAAYLRLEIYCDFPGPASTLTIGEIRSAFLPAEASIGLASLTAAVGPFSTVETLVKGITVPAGTFTPGSTYRLTAYGVASSSAINACTFRVRVGPTSMAGNIAGSRAPNSTAGASADGFKVEFLFTVRTVGAGGTCIANGEHIGGQAQPFNTNAFVTGTIATVAVDTTVANRLELTAQTAAGTTTLTFHQALIECVMAS